ncbi:hypothetical protein ACFX1S_028219 [Malus domestica]
MNLAPIIEENLQQIPANLGKGKAAPTSNQSLVGKLNTLMPDTSSIMSGICERIFIEVPHLVIRTVIGSEPLPLDANGLRDAG